MKHEEIMREKRFVWNGLKSIRPSVIGIHTSVKIGIDLIDISDSELIKLLIEKLNETFIGCDFIMNVDPSETYVIIDWS
jgi:hypothetical protein